MAFFGAGQIALISRTAVAADRQLFAGPYSSVNIEGSTDEAQAQGWIDGKLRTTSSSTTTEDYTLTLQFQETDWRSLELAFGELSQETASITLPQGMVASVPMTSPYEVAIAGLTGSSEVQVVVQGSGASQLEPTTDYTVATDKITFQAEHAGKGVYINYFKTFTSIKTIGAGATATGLSEFEFYAKLYGPNFANGVLFYAPKVSLISLPSYETGDVSEWEMQFRMANPPGARKPYRLAPLPA